MITRFDIKNFRTCQDVSIEDMGSMLVFLGANGVGKTNILQAFQWVAETITGTSPVDWHGRIRSAYIDIDISATFIAGSENLRYDLSIRTEQRTKNSPRHGWRGQLELVEHFSVVRDDGSTQTILERRGDEVRLSGNGVIKIDRDLPSLPAVRSLVPDSEDVIGRISEALAFWESVAYYPLDEPSTSAERNFIEADEYQRWRTRVDAPPYVEGSVLMRVFHLKQNEPDTFNELVQLVGANGLNVIDDIKVTTFATGIEEEGSQRICIMYFKPNGHTSHVRYEHLSLGTRRILRLVVSVLFDRRSVSLIEHPEDAVHAQLLHKVTGFLRSYADPAQFLLTSHSPSVFNTMQPDEVRLVSIKEGVTQVRALTAKEQEIAQGYISTEGSLADFLEAVEGDE